MFLLLYNVIPHNVWHLSWWRSGKEAGREDEILTIFEYILQYVVQFVMATSGIRWHCCGQKSKCVCCQHPFPRHFAQVSVDKSACTLHVTVLFTCL